jgi:HSP20 family protein
MAEVKEMARPRTDGPQASGNAAPSPPDRERRRIERLAPQASAPATPAYNPLAFIRQSAEEVDRLAADLAMRSGPFMSGPRGRARWVSVHPEELVKAAWSPRVEIWERDGILVVRAELPGLSTDEIQVDVSEAVMVIQGERKRQSQGARNGYPYSERSYGTFYRTIPLSEGAYASKATAELRNGVLEVAISVPPRPQWEARGIEICDGK